MAEVAALEVDLAEARSEYAQELARAGNLHSALFNQVDSLRERAGLRYEPHGNTLLANRGPWWHDYHMQVTAAAQTLCACLMD